MYDTPKNGDFAKYVETLSKNRPLEPSPTAPEPATAVTARRTSAQQQTASATAAAITTAAMRRGSKPGTRGGSFPILVIALVLVVGGISQIINGNGTLPGIFLLFLAMIFFNAWRATGRAKVSASVKK